MRPLLHVPIGPLTVRATERSPGAYSARVKVPRGGIRRHNPHLCFPPAQDSG